MHETNTTKKIYSSSN